MVMRVEAVAALNKGETVSEVAGVQEPTFAEVSRASILLTPCNAVVHESRTSHFR
jgi:hypothetical protein